MSESRKVITIVSIFHQPQNVSSSDRLLQQAEASSAMKKGLKKINSDLRDVYPTNGQARDRQLRFPQTRRTIEPDLESAPSSPTDFEFSSQPNPF